MNMRNGPLGGGFAEGGPSRILDSCWTSDGGSYKPHGCPEGPWSAEVEECSRTERRRINLV